MIRWKFHGRHGIILAQRQGYLGKRLHRGSEYASMCIEWPCGHTESCYGGAVAEVSDARSLPMQFEMQRDGSAEYCGNDCRVWVSAIGAIIEHAGLFEAFAKGRNLRVY
jgi:hypothetical protein